MKKRKKAPAKLKPPPPPSPPPKPLQVFRVVLRECDPPSSVFSYGPPFRPPQFVTAVGLAETFEGARLLASRKHRSHEVISVEWLGEAWTRP